MATQSITNVALLASRVDNNNRTSSSNSADKAAQRQSFAVELPEVETQKVEVELSQEALEKVVSQLNATFKIHNATLILASMIQQDVLW